MHDPLTVAHEIKLPWKSGKNSLFPKGLRPRLITIWHKDPCTDGTDDSCGWFMRNRHGDKEMFEKIKKALNFSFDSSFEGGESGDTVYYTGYFNPANGMPNFSTQGIALDMFDKASWEFFNHNRKKHRRWMKDNLYEILHFAENPIDSLKDEVRGIFRIGTNSKWNREEALDHYASIIFGWILRSTRKWYQHPRWHIWHWRIQIHPLQDLRRRYWDKCSVCGKRGFKSSAIGSWSGDKIWHQECDKSSKDLVSNK